MVDQAGGNQNEIRQIISLVCVPDIPEIREQSIICTAHFLKQERRTKERVRLGSAAIAAVKYDEQKRMLDVEFRGRGTYRYRNVPEFVYRELLKAESAGAFWNAIKDQFDYEKLR